LPLNLEKRPPSFPSRVRPCGRRPGSGRRRAHALAERTAFAAEVLGCQALWLTAMIDAAADAKEQAIRCWTTVPCGSRVARGEPGSREYFEALIAGRHAYAPWMAEALDYKGARGLDVLDVGCGQGIDLARLARAGANVTGVDLTPRHVELARRHLEVVGIAGTVVEGDAESLPFLDQSFDRVISNGVLHHTPDFDRALREIRRVLRPGGEARLILYHRDSVYYWLTQVLGHGIAQGRLFHEHSMSSVMARHEGGSHEGARPLVRVYSRRQARLALERAGFAAVRTSVRHFRFENTPFTKPLARFAGRKSERLLQPIGNTLGWYLVVVGRA
jgi:2-polyprenyl-3-methyl-5-hydroxy-6-metoxy-1,4-benzoquinol methylase